MVKLTEAQLLSIKKVSFIYLAVITVSIALARTPFFKTNYNSSSKQEVAVDSKSNSDDLEKEEFLRLTSVEDEDERIKAEMSSEEKDKAEGIEDKKKQTAEALAPYARVLELKAQLSRSNLIRVLVEDYNGDQDRLKEEYIKPRQEALAKLQAELAPTKAPAAGSRPATTERPRVERPRVERPRVERPRTERPPPRNR